MRVNSASFELDYPCPFPLIKGRYAKGKRKRTRKGLEIMTRDRERCNKF